MVPIVPVNLEFCSFNDKFWQMGCHCGLTTLHVKTGLASFLRYESWRMVGLACLAALLLFHFYFILYLFIFLLISVRPIISKFSRPIFEQQNTLVVPRYRLTTYGCRAFSVAGPTAWNSFPVAFRDPTISDACFWWHLKTVLFAQQRRHHSV